MTFRARIHRTDPQSTGGQFGTLSGFLRNNLKKKENETNSPALYLGPKSFRTFFEKRTLAYSLRAPLLGLDKSIYYPKPAVSNAGFLPSPPVIKFLLLNLQQITFRTLWLPEKTFVQRLKT